MKRAVTYYLIRVVTALSFISPILYVLVWMPLYFSWSLGFLILILIFAYLALGLLSYLRSALARIRAREAVIKRWGDLDQNLGLWNVKFDIKLEDETPIIKQNARYRMVIIQGTVFVAIYFLQGDLYTPLYLYALLTFGAFYLVRSIVEDLAIAISLMVWEKEISKPIMIKTN
jgi:hypothetical protein